MGMKEIEVASATKSAENRTLRVRMVDFERFFTLVVGRGIRQEHDQMLSVSVNSGPLR